MKKYALLLLIMFMGYHMSSFAQAVDDRAVVPVSVTLNSILRLNVESGGNIEFNFNTLEQYKNGINGITQDRYSTEITVASSVNWDLRMGAEDGHLVSTDVEDTTTTAGTMPLDYIVYQTSITASGGEAITTTEVDIPSNSTPQALEQISTASDVIACVSGQSNAGGIEQNAFKIDWACGDPTITASRGSLLGSNLTGGRYSTNVFFILQPADF